MFKNIINKRRANGKFRVKNVIKKKEIYTPKKKQALPFSPGNYSRGRAGNIIQAPNNLPRENYTEQITKTIESKFHVFERATNKSLNELSRHMATDISKLNKDSGSLNTFKNTTTDRISDIAKQLLEAKESNARAIKIIASFSYSPLQNMLIKTANDPDASPFQRRAALDELKRSIREAHTSALHSNRSDGGLNHDVSDPRKLDARMGDAKPAPPYTTMPDAKPDAKMPAKPEVAKPAAEPVKRAPTEDDLLDTKPRAKPKKTVTFTETTGADPQPQKKTGTLKSATTPAPQPPVVDANPIPTPAPLVVKKVTTKRLPDERESEVPTKIIGLTTPEPPENAPTPHAAWWNPPLGYTAPRAPAVGDDPEDYAHPSGPVTREGIYTNQSKYMRSGQQQQYDPMRAERWEGLTDEQMEQIRERQG